jgi:hypothetical protein
MVFQLAEVVTIYLVARVAALVPSEHIGGFWVLEAVDLNEALAWGRKAAVACRAPVEVRPFN